MIPEYRSDGGAPITKAQIDRATEALSVFVLRWGLPLNPEDLIEMAHAVLMHHDGAAVPDTPGGWQEIDHAVNAQIDEFEERWGRGSGGHPPGWTPPMPSR
jgi:hypothetical protein